LNYKKLIMFSNYSFFRRVQKYKKLINNEESLN